jgi:hypothetical protein
MTATVGAVAYVVTAGAEEQRRQRKQRRWWRKKIVCPGNENRYVLFIDCF